MRWRVRFSHTARSYQYSVGEEGFYGRTQKHGRMITLVPAVAGARITLSGDSDNAVVWSTAWFRDNLISVGFVGWSLPSPIAR